MEVEMDLRDYLAAKALAGVLAADERDIGGFESAESLAAWCYAMADVMIAEKEKRPVASTVEVCDGQGVFVSAKTA